MTEPPTSLKTQSPNLKTALLRGAGTAFCLYSLGTAITYGLQILLAQWLGATEYGIYEYAQSLSGFLAFLAGLGLSGGVLRFVPKYIVERDWSRLRGLIRGSWEWTANTGIAIAILAMVTVFCLYSQRDVAFTQALMLGVWAIPLIALSRLQLEAARSLKKMFLAYAPVLIIYPALFFSILFAWRQTQQGLNGFLTILFSILALFIVTMIQFERLRANLPSPTEKAIPIYALRQWAFVSLPMLLIDGSFMVLNQTDTLMIGALLDPKQVGIYNAAFKTASIVSFVLVAVNAIAAPLFSELYTKGDRAGLQKLVSTIAQWLFYPAFVIAVGLIYFADPLLHLFGGEFAIAKPSLIALIFSQLVNVGAGSVGYLLLMTGHHNQCARVVGICALLNVLLNWVGILGFGIFGAAIATAISMALWNLWLYQLVRQHVGVDPSIWGAWRRAAG
jgi:O-antigen/teichoic acid export membrane protein